jgi:hypothetical protein
MLPPALLCGRQSAAVYAIAASKKLGTKASVGGGTAASFLSGQYFDLGFDLAFREIRNPQELEHDLEKWKPVFGKDHAQTKHLA